MGSWDAEAAMSRCILKQSELQRDHPRYRGRGGDGPGGDLLGNDLFLTLAAQKTIEEISAMLPPEAMQLIELVLARCNAAEEGGEV